MNILRQFKITFEDPYLVAKIQNCFGVSYDKDIPMKPIVIDEYYAEENTTMLRKKSVHSVDDCGNKDKDNYNKLNCHAQREDSPRKLENGSIAQDTKEFKNYTIKNKFWYYLFLCGTYLGDEIGYAVFLPFWFWNVDGPVARKLVLVWTVIMYIGQSLKDIVKWPRPTCPPVIRLQKKWAFEYGMPSTHAMVGVAFPSTVLYFTSSRYEFPIVYGIVLAVLWCILISLSRLYLGMHSLLDVLAGLLLSSLLLIALLPVTDYIDGVLMEYNWSPAILVLISVILLSVYPSGSGWTSTKSDTSIILGTCVGIQTGWWFNFHYHIVKRSESQSAYITNDLEWSNLGYGALRMLVGLLGIFISMATFDILFRITDKILEKLKYSVKDGIEKRRVPFLDSLYKYLTFSISSFHVVCSLPVLFRVLNIERPSYYIE